MTDPDTLTAEKLADHIAQARRQQHFGDSDWLAPNFPAEACSDIGADSDPCAVSRRGVIGLLVFLAAFWLSVGAAVYVAVH